MDSYTTIRKIHLSELKPEINNALIVGIIIAKEPPYAFHEEESTLRTDSAVWNFVLRDSPFYYVNVICWGPKSNLMELDKEFKIGVVVNIFAPQIELRHHGSGKKITPIISSLYNLNLRGDISAKLFHHHGNIVPYLDLMRFVTKPVSGATSAAEIQNLRAKQDGIDIFGIVRFLGNVQEVSTDEGLKLMREIILIDQTSCALRVHLLDPEIIVRAEDWKVSTAALFITNVYCDWSNSTGSVVATTTSRSIVTEDPIAPETTNLKNFFSKMNPSALVDTRAIYPKDLSSIRDTMTIKQVMDMSDKLSSEMDTTIEEQQFTAIIYAMITQVEFGSLTRLITLKCSRCELLLGNVMNYCPNNKCNGTDQAHSNTLITFDLRVMLTDRTGSLRNCRLYGATAEKVLNCTVDEYIDMSDINKAVVENKMLMKFCTARIHVMSMGFHGPTISILSCDWTSPDESSKMF